MESQLVEFQSNLDLVILFRSNYFGLNLKVFFQ